jgi:Tfp pilus assembly protein PilV
MIITNLILRGSAEVARRRRTRQWRRRVAAPALVGGGELDGRPHPTPSPCRRRLANEEGIALIEVMISTLMLGFIVIASFNGFNAASRASSNERINAQAAVLASQSLESLRSDSVTSFDELAPSTGGKAHIYTQTVGNETYTITQEATWVNDSNPSATCSATNKEETNQNGDYVRATTTVSWPQQEAAHRPKLTQYSILTPPDGSSLEVDVTNGRIPEQPVSGATVTAGEAKATTGEAGCVVFGHLPDTRINVEAYKLGDVTPTGAIKKIEPELLITPNLTTKAPAVLNAGSRIKAEFTYEGTSVKSDTFVAYNPKINVSPDFELGSTEFATPTAEGEYEAKTGKYEKTATTPVNATYYPTGDLFPFESAWQAYAGDCPANNPDSVDSSQFSESSVTVPTLEPGQEVIVKVPTSEVKLQVYTGTSSSQGSLESKSLPVTITDSACSSSAKPNNASKYNIEHVQSTTSSGALEYPYQPFGKSFTLCVYSSAKRQTYSTEYANEATKGAEIGIYLKETAEYTESHGHKVKIKTGQSSNTC